MPLILSGSGGISGVTGTFGKETMPVGSVIQVVHVNKSDRWSTTSQAFVDVTGLTASITPTYSTSKILVSFHASVSGYQHFDIRLARTISGGSQVPLAIGDAVGSRTRSSAHHYALSNFNTTYDSQQDAVRYLDAPNTVLPITYAVQAATPNSPYWVGINQQSSEADAAYSATTFSSITLMEIKG